MVRGQDIRNAQKSVLEWGRWSVGGMQAAAFPLSKRKNRAYRLGSSYRWRVIRFEAATVAPVTCRLLLAYNPAKEQFLATLAVENDRDMSVVASYEFHGTHPGWHLHAACGHVETIPTGSMRGSWQKRIPGPRDFHRRKDYGIRNDDDAMRVAGEFFLLHKAEGLLL